MDKTLTYEELNELIVEVQNKIEQEIYLANRLGNLTEILKQYGFETEEYSYCVPRYAKILVIGQSDISKQVLEAIAKKYNLPKDRFEFILNYDLVKNYPMDNLRYNYKYSDIFIGPIPHKTNSMGDCSSIIAKIKNNQKEYPKLTELKTANELKITKKSFEEALIHSQLINSILLEIH